MRSRGEIWLANLNPGRGTEPGKVRPVLLLQNQALLDAEHPSTLVIPLTTNLVDDAEPLRLRVVAQGSLDRGRVHQHVFTGLQFDARHQHMPGRNGYQRQRGRFFPTQIFRLRNYVHARRCHEFGVTAIAAVSQNVVLATKIVSAGEAFVAMPA